MHERRLDSEISLRGILVVGVTLVVATAAVAALMWFLSGALDKLAASDDPPLAALPEARTQQAPEGPLLQTNPVQDLRQLRQEEDSFLGEYSWSDEQQQLVQIPIDVALAVFAAENAATSEATPVSELAEPPAVESEISDGAAH